jgi:Na+-transporting NADH:ubiquinone oxidoreductase subunit NqrE
MGRIAGSYLAAVISTYLVGVIFVSQGNIANVVAMGFQVTITQRLDAVVHDLTHMTGIYLPVIAVSMLISLPVAAMIIRYAPHLRSIGYILAGITALLAIHMIIKMVFGISGIAPTRTLIGLLAQGVAGGVGGYLFHRLSGQNQLSN